MQERNKNFKRLIVIKMIFQQKRKIVAIYKLLYVYGLSLKLKFLKQVSYLYNCFHMKIVDLKLVSKAIENTVDPKPIT